MCGRFTLTASSDQVAQVFDVREPERLAPRYNIAPSQPVAMVRINPDKPMRELALAQWGLVPFWAKDPSIGNRMINARAETLGEKPSYRAAFKRRRCLIPADGFYEWRKTGSAKQPYLFAFTARPVFAFAGLWESWSGPDGSQLESCTIITTTPSEVVKTVHNRMPVILQDLSYELWLDPAFDDREALSSMLRPFESRLLKASAVSDWVNNPSHDDARCIEPLT